MQVAMQSKKIWRTTLISVLLLVCVGVFFYATSSHAATSSFSIVPAECRTGDTSVTECGLNALVGIFVRVGQFIFGITGSIALAMFVLGGFYLLTSGGSPERVQKGKNIITGSVVGLIIVFGAYTGVQFIVSALSTTPVSEGQACRSDGKSGTSVFTGSKFECIPRGSNVCSSRLASLGYSCTNLETLPDGVTATDYTCLDGFCPGGREIKCCIPLSEDVPSGGGGGPE